MPTNPSGSPAPALTGLSAPPNTSDIVNFDARADTHVAEMQTMVTQLIDQLTWIYNTCVTCYNNAIESFNSATASANSATASAASAAAAGISSGAVLWVSGATVAQYAVVISPASNYQTFRRITATGSGTTDPLNDKVNYVSTTSPYLLFTNAYLTNSNFGNFS